MPTRNRTPRNETPSNRKAGDQETSVTDKNIAGQMQGCIEKDENIKKAIRSCCFLSFGVFGSIILLIIGITIGSVFDINLRESIENVLEKKGVSLNK